MTKLKLPEEKAVPTLPGEVAVRWLRTGAGGLEAMLEAIAGASRSILFEMYIFKPGPLGERFRDALLAARLRGVRVQVLLDAFGSLGLSADFWNPLVQLGGECRWFNAFRAAERYGRRNHRKLLVVDGRHAIVGGFNVAEEYNGDGVASGWRDLGMWISGPPAVALEASFAKLFAAADSRPKAFGLFRKAAATTVQGDNWTLLLSEPGRGGHRALKRALLGDLAHAQRVRILCGYFAPTRRLRQALMGAARRGARVQLILAGRSDVEITRLAAHSLYAKLMRAGVEIYEYQPQILHAKLFVIDSVVFAGSANLDARSLNINHELTLRIDNEEITAQARELFDGDLRHCLRIDPGTWRASRSLLLRVLERVAHFLVARIDPYITSLRWRTRANAVLEKHRRR